MLSGNQKIKPKKQKTLIRTKTKNSLKDLLEQYNKLKEPKIKNKVDTIKLKKLKTKVQEIYKLVEFNLKKAEKTQPKKFSFKNSIGRKCRAAITIQKHIRGYLCRKFIWNYVIAKNPTFNSVQELEKRKHKKLNTEISIDNQKAKEELLIEEVVIQPLKIEELELKTPIKQENDAEEKPIISSRIRSFVKKEYSNWSKLSKILNDLNTIIRTNKKNDQSFEFLFQKMQSLTVENMQEIKNKYNVKSTIKLISENINKENSNIKPKEV